MKSLVATIALWPCLVVSAQQPNQKTKPASTPVKQAETYQTHIDRAVNLSEKELYAKAIQSAERAMKLRPKSKQARDLRDYIVTLRDRKRIPAPAVEPRSGDAISLRSPSIKSQASQSSGRISLRVLGIEKTRFSLMSSIAKDGEIGYGLEIQVYNNSNSRIDVRDLPLVILYLDDYQSTSLIPMLFNRSVGFLTPYLPGEASIKPGAEATVYWYSLTPTVQGGRPYRASAIPSGGRQRSFDLSLP